MSPRDSASAYHQSRAFGATAVGQLIALYDTILRDFGRAIGAIDNGKIEERVNAANHALVVIGQLQGVLDFARGGQPARHLNAFYNVTRAMATEATIASSREKFLELISMFGRLRTAWLHAEHTVTPCNPSERPGVSSDRQPSFSQVSPDAATIPAGSGNGNGWNA